MRRCLYDVIASCTGLPICYSSVLLEQLKHGRAPERERLCRLVKSLRLLDGKSCASPRWQLAVELRIGAELEMLHPMRLQPVMLPDAVHGGGAELHLLGQSPDAGRFSGLRSSGGRIVAATTSRSCAWLTRRRRPLLGRLLSPAIPKFPH